MDHSYFYATEAFIKHMHKWLVGNLTVFLKKSSEQF